MHITNHVFHTQTGQKLSIERLLTGHHKLAWSRSFAKEFGYLVQGVGKTRPPAQYIQGGARYCTADIQNFYLNNPMKAYRYMRITLHLFPDEIMNKYNLNSISVKGYFYIEIQKGMYGLIEASIITFQALVAYLAPYGYYPVKYTPGL